MPRDQRAGCVDVIIAWITSTTHGTEGLRTYDAVIHHYKDVNYQKKADGRPMLHIKDCWLYIRSKWGAHEVDRSCVSSFSTGTSHCKIFEWSEVISPSRSRIVAKWALMGNFWAAKYVWPVLVQVTTSTSTSPTVTAMPVANDTIGGWISAQEQCDSDWCYEEWPRTSVDVSKSSVSTSSSCRSIEMELTLAQDHVSMSLRPRIPQSFPKLYSV